MLSNIKEELLSKPEILRDILEEFGYANIKIRDKYMSFGRDQSSSAKSIVIRLENNKYLYVTDYPRGISKDLFSYIIEQRGVTFKAVISSVNRHLGIEDYGSYFQKPHSAFGGYYNKIKKHSSSTVPKLCDQHILDRFPRRGNLQFLRDHISLSTQKYFGLRFDVENDGIIIPIYDQFGSLIGAKERVNHAIGADDQKYWYLVPCRASLTLYGYAQNYQHLAEGTVLIFEAEKSVMQCHSYGVHNAVALGSGSISTQQIKMLYEIQPERVIFLHDYGFDKDAIQRNIELYRKFGRFSETQIGYWDWEESEMDEKYSPSDLGKSELERILKEEIVYL